MKKKMFDNSNMQEEIVWGNIPVGNMTDEELHSKNWEAITKGRDNAKDPVWQAKQKAAQERRKNTGWNEKMKGNTNGNKASKMKGKKHTEESKEKIRQAMIGKTHTSLVGVPKPKETCPHCGKVGGRPQMFQFHFDKCKHKL